MWIRPTTPDTPRQTLLAKAGAAGRGFALELVDGRLTLRLPRDGPDAGAFALATAVREHTWYFVAARHDDAAGSSTASPYSGRAAA
jgi:hypothetical protein